LRGISIILCCYNSAERLPETLRHIASQKTREELQWEVIIVNNNSQDNTVEVAKKEWSKYPATCSFKIIDQPIPGLSFAREKGIETARFDYLLFCDDDNWLCDTYVQTAYEIMEEHPEIGGLGGWCEAVFEAEKPVWFDLFAHNFAVSRQGEESGDITDKKGCLYGAGLVTRKRCWFELKEKGFTSFLSDRIGNSLSSGGDTEYSYALRLLGYKIWFDERLYFKHFMPAARMDFNYLKRLRKAMSESEFAMLTYLHELNNTPCKKKKQNPG